MKLKKTIRKALVVIAWTLVSCGMFVLLAAANSKQQQHLCSAVTVTIRGGGDGIYSDKADILKVMEAGIRSKIINKPVTDFNLSGLEKKLENGAWVRDAELYFDSRDVLHVLVLEREPIARVFTVAGTSFYIDSAGKRLPLLDKVSVRVPVITNFIAAKKLNTQDSALLKDISRLVQFISADSFWKAQLAQIDITPARTFELVPVVGNHIIRLGTAQDFEEKLQRLFVFYQQVLSKTGFDKYAVVDVQYKNQVVASQRSNNTGVDSIQLQKNIKELIGKTKLQALSDSLVTVPKTVVVKDTAVRTVTGPVKSDSTNMKSRSGAVKNSNVLVPVNKPKEVTKKAVVKPKAVMRKNVNEY